MEVLLTGATGHLRRHLLPLLVSDEDIAKIYSGGVRNPSKLSAISEKIVIHTGDLMEPSLGLSAASFASLASRIDTIIHCAAKRSFQEPYRSLRKYNVQPTEELIMLAGARKIPIHFLSSGSLATGSAASASSFTLCAAGSEGYLTSKWVCERMLERASTDLNITACIYRTTSVMAESGDLPDVLLDDFAHFSVAAKAQRSPTTRPGVEPSISCTQMMSRGTSSLPQPAIRATMTHGVARSMFTSQRWQGWGVQSNWICSWLNQRSKRSVSRVSRSCPCTSGWGS